MATVETIQEPQRFVMRNLDWPRYRALADVVGETHVRLTYETSLVRSFRQWVREQINGGWQTSS